MEYKEFYGKVCEWAELRSYNAQINNQDIKELYVKLYDIKQ